MKKYMHNRVLLKICLFVVIVFIGCDKGYLTYDTSLKSGLYSTNQIFVECDSTRFRTKITDDTIVKNYSFTVLGMPVNYDREILFKVLETNMPEGKYKIKDYVVKARTVQAIFTVELYNDIDMEGSKGYIIFQLQDNDEFRILKEFTPNKFYIFNEVVGQGKPKWWNEEYLGPFSIGLYDRMVSIFVSIKNVEPSLYDAMSQSLGSRLEVEVYTGEMWTKYRYPMIKNVVYPLWEYYQAHPEEGVNVPKPNLYI